MMRKNNRSWGREPLRKVITCECGSDAKLVSRTNYPFGKKSKSLLVMGYKCKKCMNLTMLNKDAGGRR